MASTRYEVLDLLVEDLYAPWEIRVQVDAPFGEIATVLQALIDAGEARWFARENDAAEAVEVESARGPSLGSDLTWEVPSIGQVIYLVGITESGLASYRMLMTSEFDWPGGPDGGSGVGNGQS